jgi:hypothetical protein
VFRLHKKLIISTDCTTQSINSKTTSPMGLHNSTTILIRKMVTAIKITQFIRSTLVGNERALHRTRDSRPGMSIEQNNIVALHLLCYYFTQVFNSVVRRDDEYVNQQFDEFHSSSGHSYQCLVLVIGKFSVMRSKEISRQKINEQSLEEYSADVEKQLETIVNVDHVYRLLCHTCSGITLSEMKPVPDGELLFRLE